MVKKKKREWNKLIKLVRKYNPEEKEEEKKEIIKELIEQLLKLSEYEDDRCIQLAEEIKIEIFKLICK